MDYSQIRLHGLTESRLCMGAISLVLVNPVVTSVLRGASRADQLTDSLSSMMSGLTTLSSKASIT